MEDILKILFVEDVKSDAELIWRELSKNNIVFSKKLVDNSDDYLSSLEVFNPDIIISDYSLPQFDGMAALKMANEITPATPFILVTGSMNEEIAVECMKAGASDYVIKENLKRLGPAVHNSINKIKIHKEKESIKKELRESDAKYRKIFENVHDVFYEASFDGTILEVSPSIEIMSQGQYHRNELIGKSLFDFYNYPLERQALLAELQEKRTITDYEITLANRDGSLIIGSISAKITFDSQGSPEHIIGSIRDITERKNAEQLLHQSHEFNESLLNTIPFGMDIVDETGTILFQSENLKQLTGEQQGVSKCWDLYRDDKKQCTECPLLKGITIGNTGVYESHRILGGRIFEISHTGMMYMGHKALLEIFQDITERKNNEAELIKAKEKAIESDRLKSAFLANISHEIRTPMNGILGFAELLKKPDLSGDQQQEYIGIIKKSGDRMLNIINDIVDISKIEAGLMLLNITETDIHQQTEFIYTFLKPQAERKGIQFLFKNGLESKEFIIKSDREKLYAILTNLVKNAIKYTDKGSIEFGYTLKPSGKSSVSEIAAVAEPAEAELEFYVKDTGIGIPKGRQLAIFDRFVQADIADTRAFQGAGLGLSISKSYVEMLGGKLWVESDEGIGSTFFFTTPCNSVEKSIINKVLPVEFDENSIKNLKILIVDDDEASSLLLSLVLKKYSKEIFTAQSGHEAIDICRTIPDLDIILMDMKMPGTDGYEATKQIRQFNSSVIIIAQTAFSLPGHKQKAIESGCNDYISKPITIASLKNMVMNHFKNSPKT
jgi:PAS domain S-box-containing protein